MKYASKLDKADMLTILLRIVIDFVTIAVYDKVYWFDFNDKKFFADTAESAAENNDVKTEDVKPEETKTENADEGNTNADKID